MWLLIGESSDSIVPTWMTGLTTTTKPIHIMQLSHQVESLNTSAMQHTQDPGFV